MRPDIRVVEASPSQRLLLVRILEGAGYADIGVVSSVEEAAALDQNSPAPDLVLMDVELPGQDGIAGMARLKETPFYFDTLFITVTAHDSDELLERAFAAGAMDFMRKPLRRAEVLPRVASALRIKMELDRRRQNEAEIDRLVETLARNSADLAVLSSVDPLTGLANRRQMDMILEAATEADTNKRGLGIVMIDVDEFKKYNDVYGHAAGDSCLRKVAHVIDSCIVRPGCTAVRYGGEEFLLILRGVDSEHTNALAEQIRARVAATALPHTANPPANIVTVSAGTAWAVLSETIPTSELLRRADTAMYRAKNAGRGRVEAWLPAYDRTQRHGDSGK